MELVKLHLKKIKFALSHATPRKAGGCIVCWWCDLRKPALEPWTPYNCNKA